MMDEKSSETSKNKKWKRYMILISVGMSMGFNVRTAE